VEDEAAAVDDEAAVAAGMAAVAAGMEKRDWEEEKMEGIGGAS
jgi:hypothetical protein